MAAKGILKKNKIEIFAVFITAKIVFQLMGILEANIALDPTGTQTNIQLQDQQLPILLRLLRSQPLKLPHKTT